MRRYNKVDTLERKSVGKKDGGSRWTWVLVYPGDMQGLV